MKRLLVMVGSPRKEGNSAVLAEAAATAAREAGGITEQVFLQDVSISPCTGCGDCRETVESVCVIEDGMTDLYAKIRASDAILLATPIYSYNMTAQAKLLIDRFYALGSRDGNALSGKRFGFLVVYGGKDPFSSGATTAMRCLHDTFARKASWIQMVHGTAANAGDASANSELMASAIKLGRDLVSG